MPAKPARNLNTPGKLINPYQPLPWQIAPWRDKSPVVLLAGPAGTGKSRLAAEKLHGFLLKYPGATGLAVRKTRASMINSTVLFLDRSVIGRDKRVTHIKSANRFEYWNGSILAYGGMADEEQREQIRGVGIEGGVDFCWMEEGIKFLEDDYQEIVGRMRGRAAPWLQIEIATNPGPPSHWINQRLILAGEASVYDKARPEDNPYNPASYIEGLQRLTGILRMRLWDGKWCQAEGLVYGEFDLDNLTDEEPDPDLPFELGIDDGYVDPRAILFIQRQGDTVLVFDEIYESRKLAETHVKQVLTYCVGRSKKDEPADWRQWGLEQAAQWCRANDVRLPEIAIYSPNAKELQGRLRLADIPARKADDDIIQGINSVRELILDGNGVRTLKVHRRCKNFIKELTEGYVYPEGSRKDNEKPKDGNDHACFVAGTMIETIDGPKPIETIRQGDLVLTRNGYKPVIASGMTEEKANVITAVFSNGSTLTGTGNHPVFVRGKDYIEMRALRYCDVIETSESYVRVSRGKSTRKSDSAPVTVLRVIDAGEVNTVFNLTVDNAVGEYFANGVLSHNCEGFRYWAYMRAR